MIAINRLLRRCHPSPVPFARNAAPLPTLDARRIESHRRSRFDTHRNYAAITVTDISQVHVLSNGFLLQLQCEQNINIHHRGAFNRSHRVHWLSTSPSSSDEDNNGPPTPIEVTVTTSSSISTDDGAAQSQSSNEDSAAAGPKLSKSSDQMMEEEILNLQSELRTHHRHAAYDAALATATHLLERTASHFGNLHPATASAHNNVGLMNKLLGRYHDAKDAYSDSLRIYGEVVGKDHASYAAALSNMGMLERGRVLESEAQEGEVDDDNDDVDVDVDNGEENTDLADLRDANNDTKESAKDMSALDRMQLNESAIEYFDEAYRIRLSELGTNHPHTISSRSQLGSAMAAAVIAERKSRIGGLVENELRSLKRSKDVKDAKEMEAYVPEAIARAAAKSGGGSSSGGVGGSRLTKRRMEAAEEHLRGALSTAVDNPRGETVGPLMYIPLGKEASSDGETKNAIEGNKGGLTLPPKKKKDSSTNNNKKLSKKKQQKLLEKEALRERRRANRNTMQPDETDLSSGDNNDNNTMTVQGVATKVTTLSAATAAQNLAVFLKNYADWLRLTLMDETATTSSANIADEQQLQIKQLQMTKLHKTLQEARHLYEVALHVRSKILPEHHPEVVATKFSLAELLDSPTVASTIKGSAAGGSDGTNEKGGAIDGDRANALREEILSAYNVEEREEDGNISNISR